MKGYEISYKPKDNNARVLLNHTLYGRLVYRNYRGRRHAYYVPGLLDEIRFLRLMGGKVFIDYDCEIEKIEDILKIFGEVKVKTVDREDILDVETKTGDTYWRRIAKAKELPLRKKRK